MHEQTFSTWPDVVPCFNVEDNGQDPHSSVFPSLNNPSLQEQFEMLVDPAAEVDRDGHLEHDITSL